MFVYCDNAATRPLCREALDAMRPWHEDNYGNASSIYKMARETKAVLENSRRSVAGNLGTEPGTVYFTSGGTEGDNWAIKCTLLRNPERKHIVIPATEHHAVLHTVQHIEKQGGDVTFLPVDKNGHISPASLKASLRPDTALVSIMAANNEIGTIAPVAALSRIVKEYDKNILFHTDAVQAVGHIPIAITPDIDLLTLSGHKFGGPKGVGVQYIAKRISMTPLLHGGGHERGLRSSTENIPGIVGLAAALSHSLGNMAENIRKTAALRDRLIHGIINAVPYSFLTGDPENRLPGNASFIFEAIEGESLVLQLDSLGICASSGSACSSSSLDPSHVLLAIGLPHELAHGSLRLTLSENNTEQEIDYVICSVREVTARLRYMSPLWDCIENKPTQRFWQEK
ncbi:MAG: aminotransferase class V-fold PLP-dependent enzyme [Oscillospiraceae bacterium]|nr:aminotransferase class V-fold PLP-dependent enzyme [Oscillospiraceae bacterium]